MQHVKALFFGASLASEVSRLLASPTTDVEIFESRSARIELFDFFFDGLEYDCSFSQSLSALGISPAFRVGSESGNSDSIDDGGRSVLSFECCCRVSDFCSSRSPHNLKSCSLI